MNITLKKEFQDWITAQIAAGRYGSAAEIVEGALRNLMDNPVREQEIERGEQVVADPACFERKRQMIRDCYVQRVK